MNLKQKISSTKAILIIIVAAAIAGVGILAYQYMWPVENEIIVDEIANWQTYTDKEHGYQIKYPSNFDIFEKNQGKYIEIGSALVDFSIEIIENVSSLEKLASLEEDKLIKSAKASKIDVSELKISWKDKDFLGLPAKELSFKGFAGGEPMIWRTYVIKDNNAYTFSSGNSGDLDNYYKMLSTFRFIKVEKPEVEKSYIKLLSPNGGEEWIVGNTYDIKWDSSGVDEIVIEVMEGAHSRGIITMPQKTINADLEKYSWEIPSSFSVSYGTGEPSPNLKIFIYEYNQDWVRDESDNYFSVKKSKTNLKFTFGNCDDTLGIDPYFKPYSGILNKNWKDPNILVVECYVKTFCGGSKIFGEYELNGSSLVLMYQEEIEEIVTSCNCVHKLIYEISGLENKDYSVSLVNK